MNNQSTQQQINSNTVGAAHTRNSSGAFQTQPQGLTMTLPATRMQAATALHALTRFIGSAQRQVIGELCHGEEKQFFYDKMVEMANRVEHMPTTYQTDGQGDQAIAHLHYFTGGCDWYITERDCETEQLQAFGEADLGYGGELGYISIVELLECGAELDLYWTPKSLNAIKAEQAMQNVNYVGHPMHY